MTPTQQLYETYPHLMAAIEADAEAKTEFLSLMRMVSEQREELRRARANFVSEHRRLEDLMQASRVKL